MSDDLVWPREIWMAEREEHDQGVVSAVLSEHATIARWAGYEERDRDFHRYVDADIYDSAERYYEHRIEQLEADLARARRFVFIVAGRSREVQCFLAGNPRVIERVIGDAHTTLTEIGDDHD